MISVEANGRRVAATVTGSTRPRAPCSVAIAPHKPLSSNRDRVWTTGHTVVVTPSASHLYCHVGCRRATQPHKHSLRSVCARMPGSHCLQVEAAHAASNCADLRGARVQTLAQDHGQRACQRCHSISSCVSNNIHDRLLNAIPAGPETCTFSP